MPLLGLLQRVVQIRIAHAMQGQAVLELLVRPWRKAIRRWCFIPYTVPWVLTRREAVPFLNTEHTHSQDNTTVVDVSVEEDASSWWWMGVCGAVRLGRMVNVTRRLTTARACVVVWASGALAQLAGASPPAMMNQLCAVQLLGCDGLSIGQGTHDRSEMN